MSLVKVILRIYFPKFVGIGYVFVSSDLGSSVEAYGLEVGKCAIDVWVAPAYLLK